MPDLRERVAAKLDAMRPFLERSGARVELVGMEDGIAQVKVWLGRPSLLVASLQMKSGIERLLKDAIPDLRGVEALNLPPHTLVGWDQEDLVPPTPPTKAEREAPAS